MALSCYFPVSLQNSAIFDPEGHAEWHQTPGFVKTLRYSDSSRIVQELSCFTVDRFNFFLKACDWHGINAGGSHLGKIFCVRIWPGHAFY